MNLLFFTPYYLPYRSGLTLLPHRLLRSLPHSWHLTVLTFKHDTRLATSETQQNLTIIRMPYLFRLSKGFISFRSLLFFHQQVTQADRVLLNLPSAESLPLALLARLYHKPLLSLFHCHVSLGPSLTGRLLSRSLSFLVQIQLRLSRKIFVTSHDYVRHLPYKKIFQSKTVEITPPVIHAQSESAFAAQLKNQKQSVPWIGFVGRLAREKGLDTLLQALLRLNHPYKLILAGPSIKNVVGESAYAQSFLSQLHSSKIPFTYLTDLSEAQLQALYQSLDVLVLPSVNSTEAFGMVQAEAMSHQVPVIASNLPGIRVPVKQTGMGLVVPPLDPVQLSRALKEILERRGKYTQPVQQQKFSQFFNQDKTHELFRQTIQNA